MSYVTTVSGRAIYDRRVNGRHPTLQRGWNDYISKMTRKLRYDDQL